MKKLFSSIVLCLIIGQLCAQKIKYKDLYPLLSVKKYDDAEPFLKQFLQDDKNVDHPNANFQMAMIYNEKALEDDVLKETARFESHADSAIIYYEYALKYIDDREVRRNDEYYVAYKRRDIRTGKFGINLGDIQFDIEEKIKALKSRKQKVKTLADYFYKSKNAYDTTQSLFGMVKKKYPTEKRLLLRLTDVDVDILDKIATNYRDAVENFESYKSTLSIINKTGYNQELTEKEIGDYDNEGEDSTDMFKSNVTFWDYSKWTTNVKNTYKLEILPLFTQLIEFDDQLDDLKTIVTEDSMSVANKIPSVEGIVALTKLKEYDNNPMPALLFKYKTLTLEYNSYNLEHNDYKDTTNLVYQLMVLSRQIKMIDHRDSLLNILLGVNYTEEGRNYAPFVKAKYSTSEKLEEYVKNELDNVIEIKREKEKEYESIKERSLWLITDDSDSIPLRKLDSIAGAKYLPITIDSLMTAGLYLSGETPAQGYFATVTPSRMPELNIKFDVNTDQMNKANYEAIKSKSVAVHGELKDIYFVLFYTPLPEQESYAATIMRANNDELVWAKNITLATAPSLLAYDVQKDELVISYDMENYGGGAVLGSQITISKNGEPQ